MAGGFPDSQLRAVFLFTPVLFTPVLSATVVVPGMVRVKRFHLARYISLRFHKIIQVVDDLIGQADRLCELFYGIQNRLLFFCRYSTSHQRKLYQRNRFCPRSLNIRSKSGPSAGLHWSNLNALPDNNPTGHRRQILGQKS
jgi:hypothetical protein